MVSNSAPGLPAFLDGGGEMGMLTRDHEWHDHPLGPPAGWPSLLKSTLRLILTSNHPMMIWWGDDLHQFYNDAYRRTLADDRHPAALGQRCRDCWAEVWHGIEPEIDYVMAGKGATWHENALVSLTRNGKREEMYWTYGYSPIQDEACVRGVLVVCADVTEDMRTSQLLKQSYVTVIESMDEGLAVIRIMLDDAGVPVDYRFLEVNPSFERQTGLVDVVGKTARHLVPDLEDRWFQIYGKVALTGEPVRFLEGSEPMNRWFEVYATPVGPKEGLLVALMFRDVTDRTRAEQALRTADRRKDEFLAMLAHELRNPLAPISAAAEMLQQPGADAALVQSASAVIGRQVRHITGLIDDLLDVSRVTRGMIPLNASAIDVRRVVADAIEQVRPLIDSHGHRLTVSTPPAPALVMGDAKRLVQVLANLLSNSVKYTPGGGDIMLRLDTGADQVKLAVIDNGIGMTADVLAHAFDLFVQAERETDRSQGGLGIGLALVKSLVELHGGSVVAQSAGLGQGSRFTITLPQIACAPAPVPVPVPLADEHPALAAPLAATGTALRAMVVDDNEDAAAMLAMFLEIHGHQVLTEDDPARVVERALVFRPHVCLLDIGLPGMDGYELARRLRATPGLDGVVLIAVTGYGDEQARQQATAAGFDHHFVKPVDPARLVALVGTLA
ncbi:PAS domain S-box-containing protein [Duganella sp. 3397]|uniref:PAS domain-containing hybrid sensor histidine kinase/response regulator n=1 Tax=Duganella sp. 3397 TaxID=2817732 RepID=UPI002864D9C8|nr:ATP-binding protein [Duganella sp. 3397]MDR7051179.1 PAS domain S-box-containing protein [Duganella sp. 3397]